MSSRGIKSTVKTAVLVYIADNDDASKTGGSIPEILMSFPVSEELNPGRVTATEPLITHRSAAHFKDFVLLDTF